MKINMISIVIPACDEEESLPVLLKQLSKTLEQLPYLYEILVIDNGSLDSTWDVISKLATEFNNNIKGIRLLKNYGQTIAFQAGIEKAKGEVIVMMDADGQNDPSDIPNLIKKLEEGYDIVGGWRYKRQDHLIRRLLSQIGNFIVRKISGLTLHDIGCSLKAYKRGWIKDVKLLGEMHRILPVYLAERGAKVTEVKVNHRKRFKGKSKYGIERVMKLIMDLILYKFFTSFVSRPIYLFGGLGFFSILSSFLIALFVVYRKIFLQGIWLSPLFFISVTLLTVGIIFILLGIIAELLVRIYYQIKYEFPYKIKEKINI